MFRFIGRIFHWTVWGAVLLFVFGALVGTSRVKDAYHSVRAHLRSNVDELVDTRISLENEIDRLREEYPDRIADLRCQLAEIDRDVAECGRHRRLAVETVTVAEGDLAVLNARLAELAEPDETFTFRGERLARGEALDRAARAADAAQVYRRREGELDRERDLLDEERGRLRGELATLESEYREFLADVGSMLREVDALERKENLVKIAERRESGRRSYFEERSGALAAVQERIERRRITLDERLRGMRSTHSGNEYEALARIRLAENE